MHAQTVAELIYEVNVIRGLKKAAKRSRTAKDVLQYDIDDRGRYNVWFNSRDDHNGPAGHNHVTRGSEDEVKYFLEGCIEMKKLLTFDPN